MLAQNLSSKQLIWVLLVLQLKEKEIELMGFYVQLPNFLCNCRDWCSRGGQECVPASYTLHILKGVSVMLSLLLSVRVHTVFIYCVALGTLCSEKDFETFPLMPIFSYLHKTTTE